MDNLSQESMKEECNKGVYIISNRNINLIIGYYSFLFLGGLIATIFVMTRLNSLNDDNLFLYTIISSFAVCCMLCSIQYLRRIYKADMNNRILEPKKEERFKQRGYILYFIYRPLFALGFLTITIFALLSGLVIITSSLDYLKNDRFLYLCVTISGFVGFSIGRIIDGYESVSNKKIREVLNEKSK